MLAGCDTWQFSHTRLSLFPFRKIEKSKVTNNTDKNIGFRSTNVSSMWHELYRFFLKEWRMSKKFNADI
jgi:hypothetical protein